MTKRDILESIINHYCGGKKAKFAAKVGVRPQTLNGWLARNSFDTDLIYAKCENLSAHYLLTGEGPLLLTDTGHDTAKSGTQAAPPPAPASPSLQERVETLEAQVAEQRRLYDLLMRTLACIATP